MRVPAHDLPFDTARFAVLDTETTGLSPKRDRVIEIGVSVVGADGVEVDRIEQFVDPGTRVSERVTALTGIRASDVRGAPGFAEAWRDVAARIDGCVWVAHNARFDLGMLDAERARFRLPADPVPWMCTMALRSALSLPGKASHRLQWACWLHGIEYGVGHRAYSDAAATARLLSRYLAYAHAGGARTLGQLSARGAMADSLAHHAMTHAPVAIAPLGLRPTEHDLSMRAYGAALAAVGARPIDNDVAATLQRESARLGLTGAQIGIVHRDHLASLVARRAAARPIDGATRKAMEAYALRLGIGPRALARMLPAA